MPIISIFYGIVIQMFWNEHMPPHFHAVYAGYKISVNLKTLKIIKGSMPNRASILVLEWAAKHREELFEDWDLCRRKQLPKKISPLK